MDHHDDYYRGGPDRGHMGHDSRRISDYHSHMDDRRSSGPEIIDRRREVCKNFLLGRCKKGSQYAVPSPLATISSPPPNLVQINATSRPPL
jgi:hypothetical protein